MSGSKTWYIYTMEKRTALWPSDSRSRYLSKETQNTNSKEYMHPYARCNIIYNSQDMEATQMPINRWMDKNDVVHKYNKILLFIKKD